MRIVNHKLTLVYIVLVDVYTSTKYNKYFHKVFEKQFVTVWRNLEESSLKED